MQLGLTSRLAIVGIASALVPFFAGAAMLVAQPGALGGSDIDADLDRAAATTAARLAERRADMEFAVGLIDRAKLAPLIRASDGPKLTRLVNDAWRAQQGADAAPLAATVVGGIGSSDLPFDAGDAVVAIDTGVRDVEGAPRFVVVVDTDGVAEILDEVAHDQHVRLAVLDASDSTTPHTGTSSRSTHGRHGGDWTVHATEAGKLDFDPSTPPRWRELRSDGRRVVAAVDDTQLGLALRGRGADAAAALAMLLAAGVLCAVAMALLMNRMLGRVADVAERIAGGDFDTRLDVVGSDANARVAGSLNHLAHEVQVRIGTLEHTVDRLDRTLAAIDDGVGTWSSDGVLETWNAGAERLTGVPAAVARAGEGATVAALREERRIGRRRILLPIDDGESHLAVELTVRGMRDGGVLQVLRDAAPALSIEQARANFLVTAAHELRTPLTSILGFAATLADHDLELSDDVRATALDQILTESNRLDAVVHSLFESSLLVRDKLEVTIGTVDLRTLVTDVAGETVTNEVPDSTRVNADRGALARALDAVIDNAHKYGRSPVVVSAQSIGAGHRVRLTVRDSGEGVPPDLHEAMFEPFNRLDPEMRSDVGGAGMGLYNARRLVEAMGGTIGIASGAAGERRTMSVEIELPTSVG